MPGSRPTSHPPCPRSSRFGLPVWRRVWSHLDVQVDVVTDSRPAGEVIGGLSSRADLTMVGLPDPCVYPDDFADRYSDLLASVSTERPVAFVLASTDVDLHALLD